MADPIMVNVYEDGDDGERVLVYREATPDEAAAIATAAADSAPLVAADVQRGQLVSDSSAAIAKLETAVANWSTLTAAQKDSTAKLTAQVVAKLARLVLNQLT